MYNFHNVKELYSFLGPALEVKIRLLKEKSYDYIRREDIWNYLKESTWKNTHNLFLSDMVNDILHVDAIKIDEYLKKRYLTKERSIDEGDKNEFE